MQWRWPVPLSALVVLLFVAPVYAQAPEPPSVPDPGAAVSVEARHQVQASDNLHLLAAYYYGDARQWVQILAANRGGIKHPSVIHPGQVLRILLSGEWVPPEPYAAWKQRVRETPAALKAAGETPAQSTAPTPETPEPPASPGKPEGG